jgi:hypothetical protein
MAKRMLSMPNVIVWIVSEVDRLDWEDRRGLYGVGEGLNLAWVKVGLVEFVGIATVRDEAVIGDMAIENQQSSNVT